MLLNIDPEYDFIDTMKIEKGFISRGRVVFTDFTKSFKKSLVKTKGQRYFSNKYGCWFCNLPSPGRFREFGIATAFATLNFGFETSQADEDLLE